MIQHILKRPYYIFAAVVILMILGGSSVAKLPIQLLPDISKNEIRIRNVWPQASPEEMEREIVEPVEALIRKINGVTEFKSDIGQGSATTQITFTTGTDMDQAYMDVIDRVNQFQGMPKTALEPVIINKSINNRGPVATLLLAPADQSQQFDRDDFTQAYEYYIRQNLQNLNGVSQLSVPLNPVEKRIDVEFDPHRLAMFRLTPESIVQALKNSVSKSSGNVDQGSRRFTVRFSGRYEVDELKQIVVAKKQQREIHLYELASVNISYIRDAQPVVWDGKKGFFIYVYPTNTANTLMLINDIHQTIKQLNNTDLGRLNMELAASQDDSKSINDAINMVTGNLIIGVGLATLVLFAFIRRKRALAVIFASLPISLVVTFGVLHVLDRSLNLISLAGIALSTGMILDAAIVMVDSIARRKQDGMEAVSAVISGANAVSGAIVTSVVSSVIIFIPIMMMQSPEGQLFHDLAITISASLICSLLVSLTLIPLLLKKVLDSVDIQETQLQFVNTLANWLSAHCGKRTYRLSGIFLLLFLPIMVIFFMMPHAEVLPNVKGTTVWGYLSFNQSLNEKTIDKEVLTPLVEEIEQHIASGEKPEIGPYLIYAQGKSSATVLINTKESDHADQVKTWLKSLLNRHSALYRGYSGISSILRTSLSNNQEISIDISGKDYKRLREIGSKVNALVLEKFPDARVRTNIPLELSNPSYIFSPKVERLQALGETQQGIATKLSMLNYGRYVSDYFDGNRSLPLFLKTHQWDSIEELLDTPFYYPDKGIAPMRSLVEYKLGVGAEELFRFNGHRTVSVKVSSPENVALQEFMGQLDDAIGSEMKALLSNDEFTSYRGSASKLELLLSEMSNQFIIAMVILFLLVTGLFQSVRFGFICILSMPVAICGGVLSLLLVNLFTFQPMDIITMLGFIILIGLVINNAILFVECYRNVYQTSDNNKEAIYLTIRYRSRAILMSTITSILGMLPLALIPGTGTEVYRGLAMVISGGMLFSLLFSVPILSMLLSMGAKTEKREKNGAINTGNVADAISFPLPSISKLNVSNQ